METFRTSYRRDFGWPWSLPVRLNAWQPPELTFERPRECPSAAAPPEPDCPCPEHSWAPDLGRYVCLAAKEARLHQRSQAVRQEIQRCLTRTQVRYPLGYPLPSGTPTPPRWNTLINTMTRFSRKRK